VIYLKHAAAKDVATLLTNLISGQSKASQSASSVHPGQIVLPPPGTPPAGQPGNVNVDMGNRALGDLGNSTNEFSGLVDIQPDERSNAVVVSGTVDDIRLIKELVDKVDVLLAQVRIEVVIAEVTLSDNSSSGINSLGIGVDGSHITSLSASAAGIAGSGSGGSVVGNLTRANGATTLSLAATLTPLRTKGNVEFLSAPTIVTTHNKEASILITQQQPVITSIQRAATSSAVSTTPTTPVDNAFNTSSSVTYKDIGIQLKVKPLIGLDNNIQLQVDQTVDDVIDTVTIDGNPQPVIGHRQATSFVNVSSDEMIVLGGLQRNRRQITHGRFGIIWEVPVLGWLFGPRTKNVTRTELLVFIRPHVIKPEENVADTNRMIEQQAEKDVIKGFLNPETRADDPDKAKKRSANNSSTAPAPGTH
jgi:general secretion pathway protein D